MLKLTALAISSTALALGIAACGSSSSSSTSPAPAAQATTTAPTATTAPTGGAGAQSIAADPSGNLKYTKTSLTAKAGKVTINFTNNAPLAHNLTIQQGTSGKILGATPTFMGGTKTLTLTLKPGTYTFFCTVPGHRMAGMQGTLTVN